jgi:hypothetical protein
MSKKTKELEKQIESLTEQLIEAKTNADYFQELYQEQQQQARKREDEDREAARAPKIQKVLAALPSNEITYTVSATASTVAAARVAALSKAADNLPNDFRVNFAIWKGIERAQDWQGQWEATIQITAEQETRPRQGS